MKMCFISILLVGVSAMSADVISVEGNGYNWGYSSIQDAQEDAMSRAREQCQGEVEILGQWTVEIVSRKEGVFHAKATAQFQCLPDRVGSLLK